jgi:hypothetical protein
LGALDREGHQRCVADEDAKADEEGWTLTWEMGTMNINQLGGCEWQESTGQATDRGGGTLYVWMTMARSLSGLDPGTGPMIWLVSWGYVE